MPDWNAVLEEINQDLSISSLDRIRRKYLANLHTKTNRNIICYYSGWLQKPGHAAGTIDDNDKNGFMTSVHALDHTLGLDLILHTPGGDIAATESLVHYLRTMFQDDIRVFIPQIAMSAGTMIACASREIYMGKQSNIGPIDPQFGGIPAHGVLAEFKEAIQSVEENPKSLPIWQTVISKYHPTFLGECKHAVELSSELVKGWLQEVMFNGEADSEIIADKIVTTLNNHTDTKTHSRHIQIEDAIEMGLNITKLEDDQELQDLVLTIHHAFMHTLSHTSAIKIIENHIGKAMVQNIPTSSQL